MPSAKAVIWRQKFGFRAGKDVKKGRKIPEERMQCSNFKMQREAVSNDLTYLTNF
jgi:hypothetical protein